MKNLKPVLSENLHALNEKHKMTQEKIGLAAGVAQATVGRAMAGSHAVDLDTLAGIARAFDVEPWQLLVPGLRPDSLPVLKSVNPAEEALYERLRAVSAELAAVRRRSTDK